MFNVLDLSDYEWITTILEKTLGTVKAHQQFYVNTQVTFGKAVLSFF